MSQRVVHHSSKDETEITADIHDQLRRILFKNYGISISREFTMGRSIEKLGETDLYFYKEDDFGRIEYAILENKNIENFTNQYNQLMGYLNYNFQFGITLSINRNKSLDEGMQLIIKELEALKKAEHFNPIKIHTVRGCQKNIIISEHIVPENKKIMRIYHMILQLNDNERKEAARTARGKKRVKKNGTAKENKNGE